MAARSDLERNASRLSKLIASRLGVPGPDLVAQVRRLGRRVPTVERAAMLYLSRATQASGTPRFAAQFEPERIEASYEVARRWLEAQPEPGRRRRLILSAVAEVVVNLALAALLLALLLFWRGFL